MVAALAVAAGSLEKEVSDRGVQYRFGVALIVADTALRSVFTTDDSVFAGFSRPLSRQHLLYTHTELEAPPSASTVHRVVMTDPTMPGIGQLYQSPFPVPDYGGHQLMLSDVALGQPDVETGWKRGDVTLALLPASQLPAGSFDVYYEVYNLPWGSRYTTEIFVERLDGTSAERSPERGAHRLRFSGESATRADGSLPELRRVEADLARGRYRITVTVEDEHTGQSASRSRIFHVRGSERQATPVVAQPRGGKYPQVANR